MFHRAVRIDFKEGTTLEALFRDGSVKSLDIATLFDELPRLRVLEDREIFTSGKLLGGYGIKWTDEADLSVEAIYDEGKSVRMERIPAGIPAGDAVVAARASRGWSQKKLAELSKIDQADISRIERGIANPSMETLARIADALDCELVVDLVPMDLPK